VSVCNDIRLVLGRCSPQTKHLDRLDITSGGVAFAGVVKNVKEEKITQ